MTLLLVIILGMVAFAIDVGYVVLVRSKLQNAADSAALAGSMKLVQPYASWSAPNLSSQQQATILASATAAARIEAQRFANLNGDGNLSSLKLLDSDVVFGFLDQKSQFSPTPPDSRFPNSIQVTLRRDEQANGLLPLFFGPVLGTGFGTIKAVSRATTYSSTSTFRNLGGEESLMLPVQLDIGVWKQFLANGTSAIANNRVITGPNGAPEIQVYPDNSGMGLFGLLDLGPPSSDIPAFRTWINNGTSPSDLQYLLNNSLLPVSMDAPKTWNAGPGLKSTLLPDFGAIIGKPVLLPLSNGRGVGGGFNGSFNIVGFAGVTITEAYGSGGNMVIAIQPNATLDPTAYGGVPTGSTSATGTAPPPTFSFQAPRLTQ